VFKGPPNLYMVMNPFLGSSCFYKLVRGCAPTIYFFLPKKEPFDWPIINIFETLGDPQHKTLNMLPSSK
jgi:hypothetical protein